MVKHMILLCFVVFCGPLVAQEQLAPEVFDARLELVLDARDTAPIEGEMVLATVRGFYRETITNEELKLRRMTDFDWIQLKPDHWSQVQRDGLPTVMFERRIAIYPKSAGALTILPIAHELEVNNRLGKREKILVRSEPVKMEVGAKPEGAGSDWLPVTAIEVSQTWTSNPAMLEDGENVERRVVLRALGVPPEMLPKQPAMREPWLITFTPPEERTVQLTAEGPVSTVVWVYYLRPITGAPGVIPQVDVPYFDTTERRAKTIVIPSSPIGYASFANNAQTGWQAGFKANATLWGAFAAGLLIAIFAGFSGRQFRARPIQWLRRWVARHKLFSELHQLQRSGDVASFRARMAAFLSSQTELDEAERLKLTAPLDREVFAEQGDATVQAMTAARRLLKALPGR